MENIIFQKLYFVIYRPFINEYWFNYRTQCGSAWNSFVQISDKNGSLKSVKAEYLFVQEHGNKICYPIRPDSITKWCSDFSKRNGLPHINPHAFRHTMASIQEWLNYTIYEGLFYFCIFFLF